MQYARYPSPRSFSPFSRRHRPVTVIATVLVTLLLTVFILNLTSSEKKIQERIDAPSRVADAQFLRSMGTLLGPPITSRNLVTRLRNGAAIFPAMLEAIEAGTRAITFETFIYWSGSIGRDFADALSERARAGLRARGGANFCMPES